jgi:hypothetical protein
VNLPPEELQRATVVAEDLAYLRNEWRPHVDSAAVRRISPILRRLLVEGNYARTWHALNLPSEPYISAPSLDAALGTIDRNLIQIAIAPSSETITRQFRPKRELKLMFQVVEDIPPRSLVVVLPGYPDSMGPLVAVLPFSMRAAFQDEEALELFIKSRLGRREIQGLKLSAYLRSPAALITGEAISRQDIIQFISNKLGGVHFAP